MSMSLDLALAAQATLWLLVIGFFLKSGQATIFHPLTFYLAFHGLAFVIRPFLVHLLNFDTIWGYMVFEPAETDSIRTLAVSSVGLVVFAVASLWGGRSNSTFTGPAAAAITPGEWKALVLVTAALTPLVAYSIYRSSTGGFVGERRGGIFVLTGDSGYVVEAQFMATPLVCIWLVVMRFRWQSMVLLVLYVSYRAACGWMRATFVLFLIALALAFCWQQRRRWLPVWILLLAIPVFLLFNAVGHRRGLVKAWLGGEKVSLTVTETANLPTRERYRIKYDTADFANFDYLTFVLAMVPRRTGTYTYGAQYLQLFTEPIPRKLWPSKPLGAPVRLLDLNRYGNFYGFTVSMPGDAWMNGGWVGLAITMAFFGWLWGKFHRWFWANQHRNIAAILYLIALAVSLQQFRDGGIVSIAKFFLWNVFPVVLWAGASWLTGSRRVPGYSIRVPRGSRVRFMTREGYQVAAVSSHLRNLPRRGRGLPNQT
jgi:hypothetical protein